MPTVKEILGETTRFIQAKEASFKTGKAAMAGENPSSMPGAENDKPVPAEHLTPDKEVDDGTQGPKGSHNPDNVGGKDDSPITRGHAVDAEKAVETPTEKPLLSADANAKTAEMCNDLLADIQRYRKDTAAQKQAAAPAKPAPAKPPTTPAKQAAAPAKQPEKQAEQPKLNLELTAEFLQKIGAILLSTEEGTEFVDQQLRKHAGAEKARELMGFIQDQNAEAEKLAAMQQGAADANALIDELTYQAGFTAGQATHEKQAGAVSLMSKLGQEVADASIEELMGGAGDQMDVPPEAMGADPAAMGADPAAMGGEEEDFSPEDVVAALEMLVQEGQLDPQDAQAILDQLGAGGDALPAEGAGMAEEAAPAEGEAEEAAPAEGKAEKGESKPSDESAE